MKLVPMDPKIALSAIEGHEDVLTTAAEEEKRYVDALRCPECMAASVRKELDPNRLFSPDRPLPLFNARCFDCGCLFEPYTKIIISSGSLDLQI